MMSVYSDDGAKASRNMRESQKALELRKFFAPDHSNNTAAEIAFNASLNDDGALDAYAETIVWRLRGVHSMVSLLDRGTQYFLAGAVRTNSDTDEDVIPTSEWFGCQTVPTPGGLCENTLALDSAKEDYSCFIVNDLSKDPRFAHLPVVDGQISAYRFYCGAPITTSHGVNIGSIFFFDDKPRDCMPLKQRKFMYRQAGNIMRHLETKREAAERRRAALMSQGIAKFMERTSRDSYLSGDADPFPEDESTPGVHLAEDQDHGESQGAAVHKNPTEVKETVMDKIRTALDHAADILRESLEISSGGVVFLDPTIGYIETDNPINYNDTTASQGKRTYCEEKGRQISNESQLRPELSPDRQLGDRHLSTGSIRSSTDKHKASKVMAISSGKDVAWDSSSRTIDTKTLQSLIKAYPQGNVWYTDDEGYFSSLDQISEWEKWAGTSPSGRTRSICPINLTERKAEAAMLSEIFQGARQMMFLPLWDAGGERYYAGCIVWSESAVPVFTVDSEIAYLSSFTNSLMVEISRLDALISNKMKSDFISSISHEFRSPLHGILASAEFLRDSKLDESQMEFISTIQNCSATLLDTINHVLDYSKINSFERSGHQGTISNELYQDTNVALLCEDIVHGMIAANKFRGTAEPSAPFSSELVSLNERRPDDHRLPLEVILDIEERDWDFKIQPGALRRIVMNVFGNAQKYTAQGYIMVQLKVKELPHAKESGRTAGSLSLHIRDTGKGMSSEYIERKLYHPFAQEDTFAPGVGLGLSIVWSIVNQLAGDISIRSELGKGTDIEVTIPLEKTSQVKELDRSANDWSNSTTDVKECIAVLQQRAAGKSIQFSRGENIGGNPRDLSWACIKRYSLEWFGFEVKETSADVIITDREDSSKYANGQRVLVIHDEIGCSITQDLHREHAISSICSPIGPFKLARSLLALLDKEILLSQEGQKRLADAMTQTPLGSPEERTLMNGIILTDYGFTPTPSLLTGSAQPATDDTKSSVNPTTLTTSWTSQQQQRSNEQFASISAISLASAMQQTSSPPSSPHFQAPRMKLTLPNPKTLTPPPDHVGRSLRILAVDDNALNLQLLYRYLLKREGDSIVTARNGVEAVEAVRGGGRFDVVFMDISMPEMDGFEATRLIRKIERTRYVSPSNRKTLVDGVEELSLGRESGGVEGGEKAYIVALTGLASRRDRDLAQECGFDDFLTKPISFARIGELLGRLSGRVEV